MPRAKTELDFETIEVEILSVAPSYTGLVVVRLDDNQVIDRHVSRLFPVDEESAKILNKRLDN